MTEYIKQTAEHEATDISETLDIILKGYPNTGDSFGSMSMPDLGTGREASPMADPIFDQFIDFSFGTLTTMTRRRRHPDLDIIVVDEHQPGVQPRGGPPTPYPEFDVVVGIENGGYSRFVEIGAMEGYRWW